MSFRQTPVFTTVNMTSSSRLGQFWGMKWLVRDSFQLTQDYYPETMGQLLVINAPSSFTVIWNVVKPWLAKETIAKIDILGSNYREVLLKYVDSENLPESLGGSCRCEALGGCDWGNDGPWMVGRQERRRQLYGESSPTHNGTSTHTNGVANGVDGSKLHSPLDPPVRNDGAAKVSEPTKVE